MNEEQKPITEPEAPAEPTLEDLFPLENFHDTIILTLRHVVNNRLVQLEVFGSQKAMWMVKGNGPHEVMTTQGNPILIDGHDILWTLFVSREEHRERAIGRADAEVEAKANEVKRLEAEARMNPVKKPKGFLAWLKGDR